jgi:hypothetical protein
MPPPPHRPTRLLPRRLLCAFLLGVGLVMVTAVPATAHGDRQRAEEFRQAYAGESGGLRVPLLASDNVSLLSSRPGSAGISGCFMRTAPTFVMSSLDSVKVFDVTDPRSPALTGTLPSLQSRTRR